jgi:hypothetical protein
MPPQKEDPRVTVSRYFDCSDTKNTGKGGNGGLTYNEIRAVRHYTGQSGARASETVNPALRTIAKLPADQQQESLDSSRVKISTFPLKTFIRHLDDAIDKVELPTGLVLYRGIDYISVTTDLGSDIGIGMKIRDAGYMSATYAESIAFRFAVPFIFKDDAKEIKRRPVYVIQVNPGQAGAVSHNECEVILPRGSVLQCIDIVDIGNRRYFIMDYINVVKGVEV